MALSVLSFMLRTSLAGVLLWAGLAKLASFRRFAQGLGRYKIVADRWSGLAAMTAVGSELAISIGLLVPAMALPASAAASALFMVFSVTMATVLVRQIEAPCNCFGVSPSETISAATLIRTLMLLTASSTEFVLLILFTQARLAAPPATVLPALTLSAAIVIITRLAGLVPQAWKYLRAPAVLMPTTSHRVSFREQPLSALSEETASQQVPPRELPT